MYNNNNHLLNLQINLTLQSIFIKQKGIASYKDYNIISYRFSTQHSPNQYIRVSSYPFYLIQQEIKLS